jgi:hypothetical protein
VQQIFTEVITYDNTKTKTYDQFLKIFGPKVVIIIRILLLRYEKRRFFHFRDIRSIEWTAKIVRSKGQYLVLRNRLQFQVCC